MLRTVEERGVRLIRLWFTDVLGQLKSFAISPGRARERLRGGHALRRLGHRRLQPGAGERRARPARPQHASSCCPWADDRRHRRPGCSATSTTSTARPFEGDPRQVLRRNLDRAREQGFTFYAAPEMEFFYFADGDPSHAARSRSTPASLLRPHHRRRRQRPAQAHDPHARGDGHPGRVLASTRTPRASTRSTCATPTRSTMADNVMTFRLVVQEIALEARRARHVHAEAARGRAGLGHAHPLLAVRGRRQRLPRPGRRVRPVEGRPRASSPACCTTPARSPRSPTSGSTPTSGWSSATRRRSTCRGPATTARRRATCRTTKARQGRLDPHRVPGARPGLQPVPRLLGGAGRRPQGHRGGLRAARPRPPPTCSS